MGVSGKGKGREWEDLWQRCFTCSYHVSTVGRWGGGGRDSEADSRLLTTITETRGRSSVSHHRVFLKNHQRCSHFPSCCPHPLSGNQTALTWPNTTPNAHAPSPQSRQVFSQSYTPRHPTRSLNIAPGLRAHERGQRFGAATADIRLHLPLGGREGRKNSPFTSEIKWNIPFPVAPIKGGEITSRLPDRTVRDLYTKRSRWWWWGQRGWEECVCMCVCREGGCDWQLTHNS